MINPQKNFIHYPKSTSHIILDYFRSRCLKEATSLVGFIANDKWNASPEAQSFFSYFLFFLLRLSAYFLPSSTPRSSNFFLFFIPISSLPIIKYFFPFSPPRIPPFSFPYLFLSIDLSSSHSLSFLPPPPSFFLLVYNTSVSQSSLSLSFPLFSLNTPFLLSPFEFHPSPSSIIFYLSSSRSSTFLLHFPRPSLRLILSAAPLPSF